MLGLTHLSGFGVGGAQGFRVITQSKANTSYPTFTVDLGPPGLKQVFIVVAVHDVNGSDPWTFSTGTLDGDALTAIIGSGQEVAGNGLNWSAGATIRAIETTKGGEVDIAIQAVSFVSNWDVVEMMAIITTGMSITPIATDSGDSQGSSNGANFTIDTSGASLVLGAGVGSAGGSIPGAMTGPGNEVTPVSGARVSIGYDRSPAGGATDTYDFAAATYVIAGAAFGPA